MEVEINPDIAYIIIIGTKEEVNEISKKDKIQKKGRVYITVPLM